MERLLGNVRQQRHLHRHMIDMKDGVVDELAQEQLRTLKSEKVKEGLAASDEVVLEFDYPEDKDKQVDSPLQIGYFCLLSSRFHREDTYFFMLLL